MKNKKNLYIVSLGIIIFLIIAFAIYNYFFKNSNFINLNYTDILSKIDDKDNFILCITATDCGHCEEFKPKLKKISNNYDIKIYYTNIDDFSDEQYSEFKTKFGFDGSTPTTILFKNGEEKTSATRIIGNVSMEKVINKLKKNGFIEE
ncbi:MAG: thioredoxin family protein [Bacilli bacterium]|nr:thioredoxin family protein [Bacilli bacterium]